MRIDHADILYGFFTNHWNVNNYRHVLVWFDFPHLVGCISDIFGEFSLDCHKSTNVSLFVSIKACIYQYSYSELSDILYYSVKVMCAGLLFAGKKTSADVRRWPPFFRKKQLRIHHFHTIIRNIRELGIAVLKRLFSCVITLKIFRGYLVHEGGGGGEGGRGTLMSDILFFRCDIWYFIF